jgi:MutS domain I
MRRRGFHQDRRREIARFSISPSPAHPSFGKASADWVNDIVYFEMLIEIMEDAIARVEISKARAVAARNMKNNMMMTPQASPTPAQYSAIRAQNPGSLLFYRMGDFYELFFEDAEIAAEAFGIVLAKCGKHEGRNIPFAPCRSIAPRII